MKYLLLILAVLLTLSIIKPGLLDGLESFSQPVVTSLEEIDCITLSDMVIGLELQNVFGATSEILNIKDMLELKRTKELLVCEGEILSSSGMRFRQHFYIEEVRGEYIYGVGPVE